MRTALVRVDVVRIGVDVLIIAVVILHCDLDGRGLLAILHALGGEIDRIRMQDFFILVIV